MGSVGQGFWAYTWRRGRVSKVGSEPGELEREGRKVGPGEAEALKHSRFAHLPDVWGLEGAAGKGAFVCLVLIFLSSKTYATLLGSLFSPFVKICSNHLYSFTRALEPELHFL